MASERSRTELLNFLDYVKAKGLLNPVTAESRKASVNKVLGILNEEEARDVTALDLDQVVTRFGNLHGKQYTPDSLRTYRSRTKASIEDFSRYLDNPLAFKSGVQSRKPKPARDREDPLEKASTTQDHQAAQRPILTPMASSAILPIPLRADLTIHVQGLPFDLTVSEARKIANVIQAMAMVAE